jgi:serine phosphatase RsbU (regulator of sigma subunit)
LLLYTDGLIERRGEDLEVGTRRLAAAFARVESSPVEESVRSIIAEAGHPQPEDDVAVLLALFD